MDVTHGLGKSRRSADEEGSNLDEFRTMKHGQMQAENKAKISESELKEAFRVFDSDGNDFIDWDELKTLLLFLIICECNQHFKYMYPHYLHFEIWISSILRKSVRICEYYTSAKHDCIPHINARIRSE
ncbi:uncharacterized protein LOC144427187 isoform X1 [Styela clava]